MKVFLISVLKAFMRIVYAPMKLLKTKNRIVWLSRQSNEKSIDMRLLERELKKEMPGAKQVFRLRMIPDGAAAKIRYCFGILGDMYYLATSRVALLDTYSIPVSCLKHKKSLKVIQLWHASGAVKKFGLQSVGTKEGRDEAVSAAMRMHKNYDCVIAPSRATAEFYMQAFGCAEDKIKICCLPRVDEVLSENGSTSAFYRENPALSLKKIVLYLPTFREREGECVAALKTEFLRSMPDEYHLIVSTHPLFSTVERDAKFSYNGSFSTYDLMKLADVIVTDYSACAFDACVLMKPLYFYVPDYDEYGNERGLNVNLFDEMPSATCGDAKSLCTAVLNNACDMGELFRFKSKYMEAADGESTKRLAKIISDLSDEQR